ncbi:MAG: TIGR02266 family protein [Myxococcaceae bacterium]
MNTNDAALRERKFVSLKLRFHQKDTASFTEFFATNIGRGGMFVFSKTPQAVGTLIQFEFQLMQGTPVFQGTGVVRWLRAPNDPQGPPGMGIQFEKVSPQTQQLIDRMLTLRDKRTANSAPEAPKNHVQAPVSAVLGKSKEGPAPPNLAAALQNAAAAPANRQMQVAGPRKPTGPKWQLLVAPKDIPREGPIVGIDLGTTHSCVAMMNGARPAVIRSGEGYNTIPSVVAVNSSGNLLIGRIAREQRLLNPKQTIYGAKRLVGRAYDSTTVNAVKEHFQYEICAGENGAAAVKLGDQVVSLEQVQGMILSECRKMAERQLGKPVRRAVVTVPAYYTEMQRQAVRRSGELAGIRVERVINEPTSAALAYGLNKELSRKVLVYDLGGGTFDVTVLRVQNNVFEVLATRGDTFLGGMDFDQALVDFLISRFQDEQELTFSGDEIALSRVVDMAERAKIALSEAANFEVNLPMLMMDDKGKARHLKTTVTRADVEGACAFLVDRTLEVLKKVLEDSRIRAAEIDEVLLVGGQSRMPLVRDKIREMFGRAPHAGVHADEAVALGAALYAATVDQISSVVLIDVLPMSIGIALPGGKFHPVIEGNTNLPTKADVQVFNSETNERVTEVHVFQGEAKKISGNEYLGTIEIRNIPLGKKGQVPMTLTLRLDAECQLSCEARDAQGKELRTSLKMRYSAVELRQRLQVSEAEKQEAENTRARELGNRGGLFSRLFRRGAKSA